MWMPTAQTRGRIMGWAMFLLALALATVLLGPAVVAWYEQLPP